jgi:hypothetical protein
MDFSENRVEQILNSDALECHQAISACVEYLNNAAEQDWDKIRPSTETLRLLLHVVLETHDQRQQRKEVQRQKEDAQRRRLQRRIDDGFLSLPLELPE